MAELKTVSRLDELTSYLKKPLPRGGVVLILSEDDQLRELAIAALEEAAAIDYSDDFNVSRFDARENLEGAILAARSYPMMAERRYVRIDHLEGLKSIKVSDKPPAKVAKAKAKKSAEKGDREGDVLSSYLQDPADSTLLVFLASKLDQRTKLFGILKKSSFLVADLKVPTRRELPAWIRGRSNFYGLKIAPDAESLLADVVGSNLQLIERSLEQLRDYIYPDKAVSAAAIEEMICRSKSESIFDMTDAIGQGDGARALALLRNMEEDGEPALMISAMITRHFRQLLTVAAAARHGGSSSSIAGALGLNPFVAAKLLDQSRNMNIKGLLGAFPKLLDLDIALKSGAASPYGAIEDTLLELLQTLKRR